MTNTTSFNKVISTEPHCFVCLVGPSGSGKTQLIFDMLTLPSMFHPNFDRIIYFYQHHQTLYNSMEEKLGDKILFVQGTDWELVDSLVNTTSSQRLFDTDKPRYLLIFDDMCEEAASSPEFQSLATSGRHKNMHVLFIKHNLFHQSKFSRTIDLNTTHIILFKSPRDQDQIGYLGRQLGNRKFLMASYKDATSEPFGHLMIDLDPRCNENLRYCNNITKTSLFYIPPQTGSFKSKLGHSNTNIQEAIEVDDGYSKRLYASAFQLV